LLERSGLKVDEDFHLAYCPERIFPGNIAYELVHNEHIIGGHDPAAAERAVALYRRFVTGALIVTDDLTAESCKLMENTYRDVNIALSNELRSIARRFGIDVNQAIEIANRHPRVHILKPGIGVGGHCLPIDPWFIVEMAPEESELIPTARRINDAQPRRIAGEIRRAVTDRRDARIGCYGITYKPDVADQRESPAWEVVHELKDDGYDIRVYDPVAKVGDYADLAAFVADVDVVIALVEHAELKDALSGPLFEGKPVLRF
jgi:UDP-N-acetyl-D-mannosaminuronic acid dehydrogenase